MSFIYLSNSDYKRFERYDKDLYYTQKIPFIITALGGEFEVETIDCCINLKIQLEYNMTKHSLLEGMECQILTEMLDEIISM